jgi:hypothetical protein
MASASFEREVCAIAAGFRRDGSAAERAAIVRIASSPIFFDHRTLLHAFYPGSCLAKALPVNDLAM